MNREKEYQKLKNKNNIKSLINLRYRALKKIQLLEERLLIIESLLPPAAAAATANVKSKPLNKFSSETMKKIMNMTPAERTNYAKKLEMSSVNFYSKLGNSPEWYFRKLNYPSELSK